MDYSKIGYHFGVLNRRSQAYITYVCKPYDITYSEYVILMELYLGDGVSQDELVQRLTADKGLVARTSKSLEGKGFISRRQDTADKRLKRLYLTTQGEALRHPLQEILQAWIEALREGLDEETLATVIKGLEQIARKAATLDITHISTERKGTLHETEQISGDNTGRSVTP